VDAVTGENKKIKAQLKQVKDGLAQDVLGLKRQVRPLIPALHQVLHPRILHNIKSCGLSAPRFHERDMSRFSA